MNDSKKNALLQAVVFMLAGFASIAEAELHVRMGGTMVYDSSRDLTWLADANYAATLYEISCGRLGDEDGRMGIPSAQEYVADLDFGGFTDWRLPVTEEFDNNCTVQSVTGSSAFYCTGGEMGNLFYNELGGEAGFRLSVRHNDNYYKFRNVQDGTYWTGTDFSPVPQIGMNFHTSDGAQNANSKSVTLLVWPVRDGDVLRDRRRGERPFQVRTAAWTPLDSTSLDSSALTAVRRAEAPSWYTREQWLAWKLQQQELNGCR